MDLPVTSREKIRKDVARIAIESGCGIDAAVRQYAAEINVTDESLREILAFVEETA